MASAAELRAKYVASQSIPSYLNPNSAYYSAPKTPSAPSSLSSSVGVPTYTGGGSSVTQPKPTAPSYNFTQTPAQNASAGNNAGYSGGGSSNSSQHKPIVVQPPVEVPPPRRQTLDEYMTTQKSAYDTKSYLENARNLAILNANLKYDPIADDLKNRVAKLVSGYQSNIAKLPAKYNPMQAQVNTDQQDMLNQYKANMAKRGLIGSGIDNASQMQTMAMSNDNRTAITGQQNQEEVDLNTQINDTNAEQEMALNSIIRDKQNYSAQQIQEAQMKLEDLQTTERMQQQSNYYKEQGLDMEAKKLDEAIATRKASNAIATRGLDINESQYKGTMDYNVNKYEKNMTYQENKDAQIQSNFLKQIGLDETKMNKEDVRYWAGLAKENYQFEAMRQDKNNQFERELGLKQGQLTESIRQFDVSDQREREQFAADMGYKYTALDVQKSEGAADRASRASLAKQEMQSFSTALQQNGQAYAGIPDKMLPMFLEMNKDIDEQILQYQAGVSEGSIKANEAGNAILGIINSSPLAANSRYGDQKRTQVENIFGIKKSIPAAQVAPKTYDKPFGGQDFRNNNNNNKQYKVVDGKMVEKAPVVYDSPLNYFKNSSFR